MTIHPAPRDSTACACGWRSKGFECGPIVELFAHRMRSHGPSAVRVLAAEQEGAA